MKKVFVNSLLNLIKTENLQIDDKLVTKSLVKLYKREGNTWDLNHVKETFEFYKGFLSIETKTTSIPTKAPKQTTIETVAIVPVLKKNAVTEISGYEKGTRVKDALSKKCGRIENASLGDHNVQVQFDNGEIKFYCLHKGCSEHTNTLIKIK